MKVAIHLTIMACFAVWLAIIARCAAFLVWGW
jgi:hypothetical protein